jgi:hypothetical protein
MMVLFLDIDGVLNRFGDERGNGATTENIDGTTLVGVDPSCLAIYEAMLTRIDPIIVLSSSWRVAPELCRYLRRQGVYFHDTTICRDLELDLTRGHEIQLWLNECEEEPPYAILDDDKSGILPHQMPHFFHADGATGITHELADRIVAHFTLS